MSFNLNIVTSIVIASVYLFYTFFILKSTPKLSDVFSLMIASVTAVSCILFLIDLVYAEKSLGDYAEHKYIFFLGSFATMWVAVQTILQKFIHS